MARARYQVLVIPYCITDGQVRFCAFRRKDLDIWQFIAGGGEDEDASIIESARREAFEEAGIPVTCSYSPLDTCCSIPADCFRDAEALLVWLRNILFFLVLLIFSRSFRLSARIKSLFVIDDRLGADRIHQNALQMLILRNLIQ